MTISDEHPDPDVRKVARRVMPYYLESWHAEWTRVAEKNRQLVAGFENEGRSRGPFSGGLQLLRRGWDACCGGTGASLPSISAGE